MTERIQQPVTLMVVAAFVVAVVVMGLNLFSIAADPGAWVDMRILFPIIDDWWNGDGNLYDFVLAQEGEPGMPSFRYPPVWAVSMLPLVQGFELRTGIAIWSVLSLAVLFGGLFLVVRHLGIRTVSPLHALILLLVAFWAPFYETFYGPTKDLMIVGLMAMTFVLSERRRSILAGAAFAIAIILKIYPAFFAFYFLIRRDFRLLAATAAWFVIFNVAPLPFIGAGDTVDFYFTVLPMVRGSSAFPENAGFELPLMAWRWSGWFHHGLDPLDAASFNVGIATAWRAFVVAGFTVLAVGLERRGRLSDARRRFLVFGIWIAAVLMLIPVSWANYQILLLFPLIALMAELSAGRGGPAMWTAALAFLLSLAVMLVPVKSALLSRFVDPGMRMSDRLAMTLGTELNDEFRVRVADRTRQLDGIHDRHRLDGLTRGELRSRLQERGVAGPGDRGPEYERLRQQWAALETTDMPAEERRRHRTGLRVAGLTTIQLIGLLILRAIAGVLALLSLLLAGASLSGRDSSADSPPDA